MRRAFVLLFTLLALLALPKGAASLRAATEPPAEVRISLLLASQQRTALTFTAETQLIYSSAGKVIHSVANEEITLHISDGGAFWQLAGSFADLEEAHAYAEDRLGDELPWLPVYDGSWRIWLGEPLGARISEPEVNAAYPELSFTFMLLQQPVLYIASDAAASWLYASVTPLCLSGEDGGLALREKGHTYPDVLEVQISAKALQVVNRVLLENFVAGSLSKEMSPGWPLEALKAQAVAIRTNIAERYQKAAQADYVARDDELSYIGSDIVSQGQILQAVAETAGQILLYQGRPIEAVFHADAGGHTFNSEEVWVTELPYLRGVPELFPSGGPDAFWSPEPSFTGTELQHLLIAAGYPNPGIIQQVVTEQTTQSGAALRMRFVGSIGEVTLQMGEIRAALQLKSNNLRLRSNYQMLVRGRLSLMALNEPAIYMRNATTTSAVSTLRGLSLKSSSGTETISFGEGNGSFVFSGGGWGHGAGLSQWGARAMAEQGYDYRAILHHYYTGVTFN